MAIPFQCECGKAMTAKEEFAGRRLRCPECQRVVTIPKPGGSAVAPGLGSGPVRKPGSSILTAPTFSPSDIGGLDVTRPTQETPPIAYPSLLPPLGSSLTETPAVTRIVPPSEPKTHPWFDQSLQQTVTPWRIGDEDLYQANVRPAPERELPITWLVPVVAIAAAIYFLA